MYAGSDLDSHPAQVVTEGPLDKVLDLDAGNAPLSGLARGEVAVADQLVSELSEVSSARRYGSASVTALPST